MVHWSRTDSIFILIEIKILAIQKAFLKCDAYKRVASNTPSTNKQSYSFSPSLLLSSSEIVPAFPKFSFRNILYIDNLVRQGQKAGEVLCSNESKWLYAKMHFWEFHDTSRPWISSRKKICQIEFNPGFHKFSWPQILNLSVSCPHTPSSFPEHLLLSCVSENTTQNRFILNQ